MKSARLFLIGLFLLVGCANHADLPSRWPTPDFYLDVRGIVTDANGTRQTQRFQVWADGFAIYRSATRTLVPEFPIPVYDSVSAYRLHPKSIRSLGRLLFRSNLFSNSTADDEARNPQGKHVVISWTALGASGQVDSFRSDSGALDRAVHIVNSFLPPDCEFRYHELSGDPVKSHVSRVPKPSSSVEASLSWHRELITRRGGDAESELELLALAYVAGKVDEARSLLERIEKKPPTEAVRGALPFLDWDIDVIEPLRRLLQQD